MLICGSQLATEAGIWMAGIFLSFECKGVFLFVFRNYLGIFLIFFFFWNPLVLPQCRALSCWECKYSGQGLLTISSEALPMKKWWHWLWNPSDASWESCTWISMLSWILHHHCKTCRSAMQFLSPVVAGACIFPSERSSTLLDIMQGSGNKTAETVEVYPVLEKLLSKLWWWQKGRCLLQSRGGWYAEAART